MNSEANRPELDKIKLAKVRDGFRTHGVSISGWAKAHNLSAPLVHRILGGHSKCMRGESHRAAVLLGLKMGKAADPATFDPTAALR
jgi:gp16 family phage-associated protein